jgi:NADH:ubiquinone oxidoreductase subunit K
MKESKKIMREIRFIYFLIFENYLLSKKIMREIRFIYFLIFANYLLTFSLYNYEFPSQIISIFVILLGIATIIYGFSIILFDFRKRK